MKEIVFPDKDQINRSYAVDITKRGRELYLYYFLRISISYVSPRSFFFSLKFAAIR